MDLHALAIRNVIGPLWARWERSPYLAHYHDLVRSQFDPPEVVRLRQWEAVRRAVQHAHDTVPFYRRRFAEVGLCLNDLRSFADFARLPVLTKADLRTHGDELLSEAYRGQKLVKKRTSGSTGVPLTVWVDEPSRQHKRACTLRADEWSGWRFGERVASVWGEPLGPSPTWRVRFRNAVLHRVAGLDTLKIDGASLAAFAARLRRRPPSLVFGHAHSVYLLADYLLRDGGPAIRPKGVLTTAMVLHDWERRTIERAFGCPATNRYGCEEVSLIACECEAHAGLHVNAEGVYVEILRDGRPAAPGEAGAVVVTDLTNRAMPLLRYQVGDVASWAGRACPCGRGLPLLERIEGREADYVVKPNGQAVSGISLTDHLACEVPGAAQMQIVQDSVTLLRFRIVRGPEYGPGSEERLGRLVREFLGPEVRLECEYVERIPQEPSGKYRFCISRVPSPFSRPQEAAR